ncbi:NAD-dependent deacylase [Actinoplanes sp. NBRC 101535]|uniref:SIR2 family NAD-dependent protein deacylase n=1 Tax=Actinoplanes sp. NBRC 101535 TaxID=3032196 RepID=UPI0024A520DC|nr:NAD-dependent deacylase [Actinoplanes sp. NBRC 101535]GLY03736.1 NAD-dependent protein deacylase 1 [Actinoplanes sp. NBRC 101535]
MDRIRDAATILSQAKRVVVFTGAGISAESGVPTFRDALTGLWERFDAQALATPQAFADDPALVWGWYEWRRTQLLRVRPNPGHDAVAALAGLVPTLTVITQNVDDLHERAGSVDPLHLHGSLFAPRCSVCAAPASPVSPTVTSPGTAPGASPGLSPESASGSGSGSGSASGSPLGSTPTAGVADEGRRITPPACERCGGAIRPGVVWFGEALPEDALETAVLAASECDVLLTVGTSGLVYPAAEIPRVAARFGAAVIQVNPQATPLDALAVVNLHQSAAQALPALVEALQS